MLQRAWVPALVLTVGLALAGCSSAGGSGGTASSGAAAPASSAPAASEPASSEPASSAPAADAATGKTIEGKGYSYTVPEGWDVPSSDVGTSQADSFAADLKDTDGFSDNVNVVLVDGQATPDQIEDQAPTGLKSSGATKVAVRDRTTVAGEETVHVTAVTSANKVKYRVDQFYFPHGSTTYVVTFSFSPKVSEADRDDVSGSVLSTWQFS